MVVLVAEERVVVEVDLGVQGQHAAVLGGDQRVDLEQAGVRGLVGPGHGQQRLHRRLVLLAGQAQSEGQPARLEGLEGIIE